MKWLALEEFKKDGVYAYRDLESNEFGIVHVIGNKLKGKVSKDHFVDIPKFDSSTTQFLRIDKIKKKKPYTKSEILSYVFDALNIFDKNFQFGVCHNCEELRFKTTDSLDSCSVCQNEHIWDMDDKYMEDVSSDYEPGDKYLNEMLDQKKIWDKVQLAIKKYKKYKKV